ncbi:MAG: hypothetical protein KAI99_22955 [Cyclobacteriaceae bacterium]|nr:hypothetical protein [Cyclobacteriaceae bacterium]
MFCLRTKRFGLRKSYGTFVWSSKPYNYYHIKEIYKSRELEINPTTRKIRAVQKEGNRKVERGLDFYNLDVMPKAS